MYLCVLCHTVKSTACQKVHDFPHYKTCGHCHRPAYCTQCHCLAKRSKRRRIAPKNVYFVTKDSTVLSEAGQQFFRLKSHYPMVDGRFYFELSVAAYLKGQLVLKRYPKVMITSMTLGEIVPIY